MILSVSWYKYGGLPRHTIYTPCATLHCTHRVVHYTLLPLPALSHRLWVHGGRIGVAWCLGGGSGRIGVTLVTGLIPPFRPCQYSRTVHYTATIVLMKKIFFFKFFGFAIFCHWLFLAWKKNLRIFGWKLIDIFCRTKNQNAKITIGGVCTTFNIFFLKHM